MGSFGAHLLRWAKRYYAVNIRNDLTAQSMNLHRGSISDGCFRPEAHIVSIKYGNRGARWNS